MRDLDALNFENLIYKLKNIFWKIIMANKGSHNFSFVFFDIRNLKTVSQIQLSLTENVLLFENYKFQK